MAVDEYGREPGVDYSSQTWNIAGLLVTDMVRATKLEEATSEEIVEIKDLLTTTTTAEAIDEVLGA